MLFSVIVPVFNAHRYIERCIQSILVQISDNAEIILIDDGSTDGSGEVCDKWAAADKRIHVIHQDNGGPGKARNVGVQHAEGSYIIFLDSDDVLIEDAIPTIEKSIYSKHPEVLIGHYRIRDNMTGRITVLKDSDFENITAINDEIISAIIKKRLSPCVWRYVIKRQFIIENQLFFDEDLMVAEDVLWTVKMLCCANSYMINHIPFYEYNICKNSTASLLDMNKMKNIMMVSLRLFEISKSQTEIKKKLAYTYICIITNHMLQYYGEQKEADKKYIKAWVKEHKDMYNAALGAIPILRIMGLIAGNFNIMLMVAQSVKLKLSIKFRKI